MGFESKLVLKGHGFSRAAQSRKERGL